MGLATVAGLALSAAGTGVSLANAAAVRARMEDVVRRQIAAAEEYQKQATPKYEAYLKESGPNVARQNIAAGEQEALARYRYLQNLPTIAAESPIEANRLVSAATQGRIGQANAAQAALQGFGNFNLQQWLAAQRAGQNLGVISNLAGARSAITPYLLSGAEQSGQSLAAVGSLLGTAGQLAGVYGSLSPYLQNSTVSTTAPTIGGLASRPVGSGI